MRRVWTLLLAMLIIGACSGTGEVAPRVTYNEGLEALAADELETAYEKLLDARDNAGADGELRFRSAMALGHTKARDADRVEVAEPEKALGFLRESSAWFQDAARLRPEDEDARKNLEKILRRVQILADKLNDEGGLEAKLERIIGDQRTLRDSIRELLTRIEMDEQADAIAYRSEFIALATEQRKLLADVGVVLDSAGDERDGIESKPEDERDEQEQVRVLQLSNAGIYLEQARSRQGSARLSLRKLSAKQALEDVGWALENLKRAREQFLDPITVLRVLASEETQLFGHTRALDALTNQLDRGDQSPATKAPPWLSNDRLNARQASLVSRTAELAARLGAAKMPEDQQLPPEQKRTIEAAIAAAPLVETARAEMDSAQASLAAANSGQAVDHQEKALAALYEAIELFADIRALIDAAHASQTQAVAILKDAPELSEIPESERGPLLGELINANKKRLGRLAVLFSDELAKLAQAAQQAQAQAQAQGQELPEQAMQQMAAEKQRFETAETLRQRALDALLEQEQGGATAQDAAERSLEDIEELRRLFFSVVEHLKELRMAQADTFDKTGTAEQKDDAEKAPLLGPLAEAQAGHLQMGEAIASALEAQADAASAAQDPNAAEQAERLGRAAEEVRKALISMEDASADLTRARDDSQSMSVSVAKSLEVQPEAIKHLDEALRILQPPQDQQNQDQQNQDQENQDQDQQEQQDQGAEQQEQQQAADEISQQEAQRRLESIREREAQRQKERRKPRPDTPPEKDW